MKSFFVATFATAAAAAGAGLESRLLGLENLDLGFDMKLPLGIQIGPDHAPTSPPPADCTDTWHPAHPGVIIDDCDDQNDDHWHWVHPCEDCKDHTYPKHVWTTSTITATHVSTVIACPTTVTNCPAEGVTTTVVVPQTVTICPVAVTETTKPIPAVTSTYAAPTTESCVEETTSDCPPETPETTESSFVQQTTVPAQTSTAPIFVPPQTSTTVVVVQPPTTLAPTTYEAPTTYAPPPPPSTSGPIIYYPPTHNNQTTTMPVQVGAGSKVQNMGVAAVVGVAAAILL